MSQYLSLGPHAKVPCIMPKRLVHSDEAVSHELYCCLRWLCLTSLLHHCSSATCLRDFFSMQTMILFVVNGHNTNPWLVKQGEQSLLIPQQCALSGIVLLLSQTYPRPHADETGAMRRAAAWGELRSHRPRRASVAGALAQGCAMVRIPQLQAQPMAQQASASL